MYVALLLSRYTHEQRVLLSWCTNKEKEGRLLHGLLIKLQQLSYTMYSTIAAAYHKNCRGCLWHASMYVHTSMWGFFMASGAFWKWTTEQITCTLLADCFLNCIVCGSQYLWQHVSRVFLAALALGWGGAEPPRYVCLNTKIGFRPFSVCSLWNQVLWYALKGKVNYMQLFWRDNRGQYWIIPYKLKRIILTILYVISLADAHKFVPYGCQTYELLFFWWGKYVVWRPRLIWLRLKGQPSCCQK